MEILKTRKNLQKEENILIEKEEKYPLEHAQYKMDQRKESGQIEVIMECKQEENVEK